jgi:hypothetical protein
LRLFEAALLFLVAEPQERLIQSPSPPELPARFSDFLPLSNEFSRLDFGFLCSLK